MSKAMLMDEFMDKIARIYANNKIIITEWNGYLGKISFKCDLCNQIHTYSSARLLLQIATYCKSQKNHNTKFDLDLYQSRLNNLFEVDVKIIKYTGLSNPVIYCCPWCHVEKEVNGKQHYFNYEYFDNLETTQRRDQIKIDYCQAKNINLIIIPYSQLTLTGIDKKLSFLKSSTTIPNGSRE